MTLTTSFVSTPTIINLDALVNRQTLYFTPVDHFADLPYPEWLLRDTLSIAELFWSDGWTYQAIFSRPFNLEMLNMTMLNFRWKACLCRPTSTRSDGMVDHVQTCPVLDGALKTVVVFQK